MSNTNMANREVCDLIFVDYATKKPFLNLDFANVSTTELTGESVYAYGGKGHPKRVQFTGERSGTLTIETQMQTVKLWEMITGGEPSSEATFIKRVEAVSTSAGTIALDDTPIADSVSVFAANDDCGTPLYCSVDAATITLYADADKTTPVSAETQVIAYYLVAVSEKVQRINIKSTTFPKTFTVYGDTIMKTENDDVLPYKLTAYKVAPQSNLSLSFSNTGDPGTITITCDLMADSNNNILDLTLIGEN